MDFLVETLTEEDNSIKHFALVDSFTEDEKVFNCNKLYYNQLGIEPIPYYKNARGYDELAYKIKEIYQTMFENSSVFSEDDIKRELSALSLKDDVNNFVEKYLTIEGSKKQVKHILYENPEYIKILFTVFKQRHFFDIKNNPSKEFTDETKKYFRVPYWEDLDYMEIAFKYINQQDDAEFYKELIHILTGLCNKNNFENFRTNQGLLKFVFSCKEEDIKVFVPYIKKTVEKSGYDVSYDFIFEKYFDKLLRLKSKELFFNLFDIIFAVDISKSEYYRTVPYLQLSAITEIFNLYMPQIYKKYGSEVTEHLLSLYTADKNYYVKNVIITDNKDDFYANNDYNQVLGRQIYNQIKEKVLRTDEEKSFLEKCRVIPTEDKAHAVLKPKYNFMDFSIEEFGIELKKYTDSKNNANIFLQQEIEAAVKEYINAKTDDFIQNINLFTKQSYKIKYSIIEELSKINRAYSIEEYEKIANFFEVDVNDKTFINSFQIKDDSRFHIQNYYSEAICKFITNLFSNFRQNNCSETCYKNYSNIVIKLFNESEEQYLDNRNNGTVGIDSINNNLNSSNSECFTAVLQMLVWNRETDSNFDNAALLEFMQQRLKGQSSNMLCSFGLYFKYFYHYQKDWVENNIKLLFPKDDKLFNAASQGFLYGHQEYFPTYLTYLDSNNILERVVKNNINTQMENTIVYYFVCFYLNDAKMPHCNLNLLLSLDNSDNGLVLKLINNINRFINIESKTITGIENLKNKLITLRKEIKQHLINLNNKEYEIKCKIDLLYWLFVFNQIIKEDYEDFTNVAPKLISSTMSIKMTELFISLSKENNNILPVIKAIGILADNLYFLEYPQEKCKELFTKLYSINPEETLQLLKKYHFYGHSKYYLEIAEKEKV